MDEQYVVLCNRSNGDTWRFYAGDLPSNDGLVFLEVYRNPGGNRWNDKQIVRSTVRKSRFERLIHRLLSRPEMALEYAS